MGGMGKTALSREAAAWWLRTGRFDRAVFISFERKAGAMNAVQLIGRALEGDDFSSRLDDDTEEGQWKTAVRLFHEQRALVVWDNFESTLPIYQNDSPSPRPSPEGRGSDSAGDELTAFTPEARAQLQNLYQDLIAGRPKGRLLVTCRPQETGLPGIREYTLAGLSRPDSLHLMAAALDVKGISTERPGYERHEMDKLLDLLADHPLSLELIAPHMKELTPAEIRADFGSLLEKFANPDAREDRNKGLRASLEFSRRRLSPAAQAMLPWLAWFGGGVFEAFLLDFAELTPDTWHPIRAELEATALLKVETLERFTTPYLRFHPTLGYAARPEEVPDPEAASQRFIEVYLEVMNMADTALRGQQPAAGMVLMAREEANFRRALQIASTRGQRREMQNLADTLQTYLQMAARNRERGALTAWVRAHLPDEVLDVAVCASIRDHAMTLLSQGQAQAAVNMVQSLLARLHSEGLADGSDPAFQIAMCYRHLGLILVSAHRPGLALEPAREAVACFEQLSGDSARSNLSAALGDLANAYRQLGRFEEALDANERALNYFRETKQDRQIAAGFGLSARILVEAHRYPEAEARYAEAMQAARAAGALDLQGTLLQHQAILHSRQGNHARAVELFKQAIALFQRANNPADEMRTCDLLATAERHRGELDAAEAWYARSRQLAEQLHDRHHLAVTAHNSGILYQTRAEALAEGNPARRAWLDKAVASAQESLSLKLESQNQIGTASSYNQLGILHRMRGDLDAAEQTMRQALAIYEPLDYPELFKVYAQLAMIARARGDETSAAAWQAKYETKRAEIERRERGEGTSAPRVDTQLIKFLTGMAQVSYAVRAQKAAIPPDLAEALAQLHDAQAPFNAIGAFLQAAASGQALLPVPSGLPKEIELVLEGLKEAIEELDGR
jgi:tetratricopeptide (TPR) repeat protein